MVVPNKTFADATYLQLADIVPFDPATGAYLTPAITYSDTTPGTNIVRYQQIAGTIAASGTNLALTAAAGAGNYVRERLKSYQFESGGRKKTVTLPASCDNGDYINIKVAATPDLLKGYGIGVIRTAGAWNVCTIKDTTVTDTGTVVTGLADGDTVSIESEWDATRGVLRGYVYKTTKPGSPQVTVYDASYRYGNTGIVAYNAGASAKTFTLTAIEIRARCLMGESNVPVLSTPIDVGVGAFWDQSNASPALTPKISETVISAVPSRSWQNTIAVFAGIRRCNLSDAGVVNAYWGEPGFAYDGSNGQVMVEIRKFYYRVIQSGTTWNWDVSVAAKAGYAVHPAFITSGREVDAIYVGAFEACCYDVSASAYNLTDAAGVDITPGTGDKLASIAGAKPLSGKNNGALTLPAFRTLANNRGAGWHLEDANAVFAQQMLYIVKYANWNSQSMIGTGVTNITDDGATNMTVLTGATAGVGPAGSQDLGNGDGYVSIAHYQTGQTTYPVSMFGVENRYGNFWEWKDGLNIKANNMPWIADHDYASDLFAHPYVDTGLTLPASNGYVSNLAYNAGFDHGFLPSAVAGSSSTYVPDYYYQAAGTRSALLGGSWDVGAFAGAFRWHLNNAASAVARSFGARLAFTPPGV